MLGRYSTDYFGTTQFLAQEQALSLRKYTRSILNYRKQNGSTLNPMVNLWLANFSEFKYFLPSQSIKPSNFVFFFFSKFQELNWNLKGSLHSELHTDLPQTHSVF